MVAEVKRTRLQSLAAMDPRILGLEAAGFHKQLAEAVMEMVVADVHMELEAAMIPVVVVNGELVAVVVNGELVVVAKRKLLVLVEVTVMEGACNELGAVVMAVGVSILHMVVVEEVVLYKVEVMEVVANGQVAAAVAISMDK